MERMKKTSTEYCIECKYHFGGDQKQSGSRVCCEYILKTGKRRGCPVGLCDKFKKKDGKEKNIIPWESELLMTSE